METKEKTCPICDGSFDPDKSLFVCEDHDEIVDTWVVTMCKLHDPQKPTISKYKWICMPCIEVDNNSDWRSKIPAGSSSGLVSREYLISVGQAGSDDYG